jgi:hypothetical protein
MMKKMFLVKMAVLIVAAAVFVSCGGKKYTVTVPLGTTGLNVRSEPVTSAADNIVTTLAEGDKVTLLETGEMFTNNRGRTAPWFRVKTPDKKTGWVFSGYLMTPDQSKLKEQLTNLEHVIELRYQDELMEEAEIAAKEAVEVAKELQKAGLIDADKMAELESAASPKPAVTAQRKYYIQCGECGILIQTADLSPVKDGCSIGYANKHDWFILGQVGSGNQNYQCELCGVLVQGVNGMPAWAGCPRGYGKRHDWSYIR